MKTEKFIEKSKTIHGDKYDYSRTVYVHSKNPVLIICPNHGEFTQTPNNHLRSNGCNRCGYDLISKNTSRSTQNFIRLAKSKHDNEYIYDRLVYKSALSKVTVKCKKHGYFVVEANSHLRGSKCKKCALINQGMLKRSNTDEFINKATKTHNNLYGYESTEYVTNHKHVIIKCVKHGDFQQTPNDHLNGSGCPCCNTRGYNPENKGYLYLLRSKCGSFIKVGISNNIKNRMSSLHRSTPFDFNLLEYVYDEGFHIRHMEKLTHSFLKSSNFKGFDGCTEWFNFNDVILSYFKNIKGE